MMEPNWIFLNQSMGGMENQHALHWDGYGAEHQKASKSMTDWGLYDGNYHKFGMMWTPEEYIFYIDDIETWRTSAGGVRM